MPDSRLLGGSGSGLSRVLPAPLASLCGALRPAARVPEGLELPRGAQEVRLGVRVSGTAGPTALGR